MITAKGAALAAMLAVASTSGIASAADISGEITVWDWNYETEIWGKALKQIDAEFVALHPEVRSSIWRSHMPITTSFGRPPTRPGRPPT